MIYIGGAVSLRMGIAAAITDRLARIGLPPYRVMAVAAAVFTVASGAWIGLEIGGPRVTTVFTNVAVTVAAVLSAAALLRAAGRSTGHISRAWLYLGLGVATGAIGEILWTVYDLWLGYTPYPGLPDVFYLAGYVGIAAGALLFASENRGRRETVRIVLDGLLIAAALLAVLQYFVLESIIAAGDVTSIETLVTLAYPVVDIIIGAAAFVVVVNGARTRRTSLLLVSGGIFSWAIADIAFATAIVNGGYIAGVADTMWIAGYLAIALGAVHRGATRIGVARTRERYTFWEMTSPYIPFLLAFAVIGALLLDVSVHRVEILLLTVSIVLLVTRQVLFFDDMDRLSRQMVLADTELKQLNRAYRSLWNVNQAVIKADSTDGIFDDICEVMVDIAGYRMAWLGQAHDDAERTVEPLTACGFERGYTDTLDVTWADDERGQGPTGTAIREDRPVVARDILADSDFAPWREDALERGYRSSIAVPIHVDDEVFGALNIYAAEPDAFGDAEILLLQELADDIGFGIAALEAEEELREAKETLEERVAERTAELEEAHRIARLGAWTYDPETDEVTLSDSMADILGIDPEQFDGTLAELEGRTAPEDWDDLRSALQHTVETGDPYHIRLRFQRPDGEIIWLEARASLVPVAGQDHRVIRGIAQDITERYRTESQLREAQRIGRIGSWTYNPESGEVRWSDQMYEILGVDPDGFEETLDAVEELTHPDDREKQRDAIQRTLETGDPYHLRLRFQRPDGGTRWIEARGDLVSGPSGEAALLQGTAQDITEKVKQEQAEDEFLAMMSHELKSPVFPITGYIEMLQDEQFGPLTAEQREKLDIIYRNAQDLIELINDLLDTSRLRMDRLDLDVQAADLADTARNVLDDLRPLADEYGAELVLETEGDTGLQCDPARVEQVLENIVRNAIQYGKKREPNTITLAISGGDDTVTMKISDHGIGMTEEQLDHLFDMFFRAKDIASESESGVGLGLPVAKGIVDLHGGSIDVESEPDEGTTFTITLPRDGPDV